MGTSPSERVLREETAAGSGVGLGSPFWGMTTWADPTPFLFPGFGRVLHQPPLGLGRVAGGGPGGSAQGG